MNSSPKCVFIIDLGGRAQWMSHGAREFLTRNTSLNLHHGYLSARPAPCADQLKSFLRMAADGRLPAGAGMMIPGSEIGDCLWLHFTPVEACDDRRAAIILVTATVPRRPDLGLDEVLRSCFGFTSAETRVARALLDGASIRETAQRLGVSPVTVRNQLRSIFRKTDVNRQAALITRLSQAASSAGMGDVAFAAGQPPFLGAPALAPFRPPQLA